MNSSIKLLKKNTYSTTYKAQNIILKLSSLLKTGVHLGTTLQEHYSPMPYIIGFINKLKFCVSKVINEDYLIYYIWIYILIILLNLVFSGFHINFIVFGILWFIGTIIFFLAVLFKHANLYIINIKEGYFFIIFLLYWCVLGTIDLESPIFKIFNIFNIIVLLPLFKEFWFNIIIDKYKIHIIVLVLGYFVFKTNLSLFFNLNLNLFLCTDLFMVSSSFFLLKIMGKIGAYISETNVVKAVGLLSLGYVSVEVSHDIARVLTTPNISPVIVKKTYLLKKTIEKTNKKTLFTETSEEKISTQVIELTPEEHATLHENLLREVLSNG